MKKYLVCYASRKFYLSQEILKHSALKFGIDEVLTYKEKEFRKTSFYKDNGAILDCEIGTGYFLWKPYIILDAMKKINFGDFLVYSDSGIEIVKDLSVLFDICPRQDGVMFFANRDNLNSVWTKRDCFVFMKCDSEEFWNAVQVMGGFQVYVKNNKSIAFLEEWLTYAKDPRIITDQPNVCGLSNLPGFKAHRHEQSILSILITKYKLEIFRNPSQWGNEYKMQKARERADNCRYDDKIYYNSPYFTLLNLHRCALPLNVRFIKTILSFLRRRIFQ